MLNAILIYRLDFVFFATISLGAVPAVVFLLRRSHNNSKISPFLWWFILGLILIGGLFAESSGNRERDDLKKMLEGFAPTYAFEMENKGHRDIRLDTAPDDPRYLSLILTEIRWLRLNPSINDIYTFRKRTDGKVVLVVDSETDYDRNGKYEGDREKRTLIGEVYENVSPALNSAFAGKSSFDGIPYTDRWGTWISAYVPMRDPNGRVEAVLGVDYDAKVWVRQILWERFVTFAVAMLLMVIVLVCAGIVLLTKGELVKRQSAEHALRESEQRFRTMADTVPVMIWMSGEDASLNYFNKSWLDFTGKKIEQELHDGWLNGIQADDVKRCKEAYHSAFQTRSEFKLECRLCRYDGEYRWVLASGIPRYDSSMRFLGYIGYSLDITELKESEAALRAERDHSGMIIKGTPAIVCGVRADGITMFINPAGEEITGYFSQEVLGKNWWHLLYPGADYHQVEKFFESLKTGDVRDYEMTLTTKYGEKRTISWNTINRYDRHGRIVEVIGFGNDVTDRRAAEEALRSSEERFRTLVSDIPGAIYRCTCDKDFTIEFISDEIQEISGYPASDFIHTRVRSLTSIVHPADQKMLEQAVMKGIKEKKPYIVEYRIVRSDGSVRTVYEKAQAVFDPDGYILYLDGAIFDVTERKKLELQLLQSQKMEMVGTLAGGIAHDLNNQLTPLMGYIDLILNQIQTTDPNHKLLEEANVSAKRCAEVVQRLINFSRPSSHKKTYVGVNRLLDELRNLFPKFLPSTIETSIRHDADIWVVYGDETELQTVLMNLVVNARDAMPDTGQIALEAVNLNLGQKEIKEGFVPGPYVRLSVRDTGSGMAPDVLSRIFEPFFTTKKKGQGTGLGLAMVFNIIKEYKGWIDVRSQVGEGTVFEIFLPANPQATAVYQKPSESKPVQVQGHGTILFADDEENIRVLGKVFLERLGYKVLAAADGEETLKVYREHHERIDAVILDMTMPKLTGKQTLKGLLAIDPKAKVILASGYTSEGTAEDLTKEGAMAFIQKPYTIWPLSEALRKVIKHGA